MKMKIIDNASKILTARITPPIRVWRKGLKKNFLISLVSKDPDRSSQSA